MSSMVSSFYFRQVMVAFQPHLRQINNNKNLHYWMFSHSNRKLGFSSFSHEQDSPSPTKQNQTGYDPSEELFGLASDLNPRKDFSGASKPRSWFGPNGQYIRELPCPSCRGRGYTPCTECGIERSQLDCLLCNGKGKVTCNQCSGDCVIWEESIDERPWEKAQSISPFKVKEDDEVDNLDIKLDAKKKTKRVYRYKVPKSEINLKISRALKSLNAKTGLISKRMKMIHADPIRNAQRVAAIKKTKGTAANRKRASEAMKKYFQDPENRRMRSLQTKAAKFYCRNCGQEGHRCNYCPDLKDLKKTRRCRECGEEGHNRRTCPNSILIMVDSIQETTSNSLNKSTRKTYTCRLCGREGHNSRKCPQRHELNARRQPELKQIIPRKKVSKNLHCRICGQGGHNKRTCPKKNGIDSIEEAKSNSLNKSIRKTYTCRLCRREGHNSRRCPQRRKYMENEIKNRTQPKLELIIPRRKVTKNLHCRICGHSGHNRRTCPKKTV